MASEIQPNDEWERVASELRAYRHAQKRAWGEIDNATLGRFIADDLSREERRQVEHALDERPELRKLTDLVRDVLADFEPAAERAPAPRVLVPIPRLLPFPRKQPSRPSIVGWAKKRSGMLVAACLLLALSGSLLDPRVSSAVLGGNDAPRAAVSDGAAFAMNRSGNQPFFVRAEKPVEPLASFKEQLDERFAYAPATAGLTRLEILNHRIDGLERQGKVQEALALDKKAVTVARRANLEDHLEYAANRERVAVLSQKQGDLSRAYHSLSQAYEIRKKELGQENKDTARTAQSLAVVLRRLNERALTKRETGRLRRDALGIVVGPAAECVPWSPARAGD